MKTNMKTITTIITSCLLAITSAQAEEEAATPVPGNPNPAFGAQL